LIELGGKKQDIIFNYYRKYDSLIVKFMGEILSRIEIDKKGGFVWGAIPYEVFSKYSGAEIAKDIALDSFARSIKGTSFALIMTEKTPKSLSVSLRARKDVDVSKIAVSLGGGGHKAAAGAKIEGIDFDAAVIKVLEKVREYANN
jgi:phosphoesterase RecJ-like protein